MSDQTGYCTKCKAKRAIKDGKIVVLKNGKHAIKGKCPKADCGTTMFRFIKSPDGKKKGGCGGSVKSGGARRKSRKSRRKSAAKSGGKRSRRKSKKSKKSSRKSGGARRKSRR